MRTIFVLIFGFFFGLPLLTSARLQPTIWYVRGDGGTTIQCTGKTNAMYPGSGTGRPCAYAILQDAVNAVAYGDTVIARHTDSWGSIVLPTKPGHPLTSHLRATI